MRIASLSGHSVAGPVQLLTAIRRNPKRFSGSVIYHVTGTHGDEVEETGAAGFTRKSLGTDSGKDSQYFDACLVQLSRPDEFGFCSYVDSTPSIVERISTAPLVIAELNDQIRVKQDVPKIHISSLHAIVETSLPLPAERARKQNQTASKTGVMANCMAWNHLPRTLTQHSGLLPEAVVSSIETGLLNRTMFNWELPSSKPRPVVQQPISYASVILEDIDALHEDEAALDKLWIAFDPVSKKAKRPSDTTPVNVFTDGFCTMSSPTGFVRSLPC
jgi:hypothetical protein